MKSKLLLLILSILPFTIFAQSKLSYNQKAEEIKKTVWDKQNPIFDSNTVPAEYANESAVVLARNYEVQNNSAIKFKFMVITAGIVPQSNKTSTYREKVKINDKVALEKFSTLEYDKIIDRTTSMFFINIKDKKEVFVGVKIIKPDGKEFLVNTTEEVLLANSKANKSGKLAIPNLQVGDIIDYYIGVISIKEGMQDGDDDKYTILLADEYPVLNYSYTFQYNKKIRPFFMSANGAPAGVETSNADNDQIITFKGKNMPKRNKEIWSSPYRELPYFCVSSFLKAQFESSAFNPLNKFVKIDPKLSRINNFIANFQSRFNTNYIYYNEEVASKTKDYFKSSKILKSLPLDSTMKIFYNIWKFNTFCYYDGKDFEINPEKNHLTANSKNNTIAICRMLCEMEIPHDILMVSSKYSNSLDDVFERDDFSTLIRINGPKPIYMSFEKINTNFNEIPAYFQGEKAIVLTPNRRGERNYNFTKSETTIPNSSIAENEMLEQINVNFSPTDMQKINVSRYVKQNGFMRISDQLDLLLLQDMDNELMNYIHGDILKKRFDKNAKDISNAYETAFNTAKKDVKKNFTAVLKEHYGFEPKEVTDYKILSSGLLNPYFEYQSTFLIESLVKKAGNNYILDVGKLIGEISKIEPEQRLRSTNIYMPTARTLNYTINLAIPKGYKTSGSDELSSNKTTTAGSFTVTTAVAADKLTIHVKRAYNKAYLDKNEWNEITTLLDAAGNFYDSKLLLEKVN